MKIWFLFGLLIIFIISLCLGYFLSSDIINLSELIVFWVLYIVTLLTILIIVVSIYINYDIRNLKGPRGDSGDKGGKGLKGESGECEKDCKLHIPYNIILFNIETHLYEKKNNSTEKTKGINETIFKNVLNQLIQSQSIEDIREICKEIFEYRSIIDNNSKRLELKNIYWKETLKRIVYSNQFKELEEYRGRDKLTEYMTYIFLVWIDLIYKQTDVKYFQTIGAEEDFKFNKINPFNEIKKYDLFYWGMSDKAKIRKISVKPLYTKKTEFKDSKEGFIDSIKKTTKDLNPNNNVKEIKMIESNNFVFSYNNRGTKINDDIYCYKLKQEETNIDGKKEIFYPLGDICVNTSKKKGDKKIFGEYGNVSEKEVPFLAPNISSVLVSGSCFKEPESYKKVWEDWQTHNPLRHGWPANGSRHSHYKGYMFKPVCEEDYTPFGYSVISTRQQTKEYNDEFIKDGRPKKENGPRCVKKDCIDYKNAEKINKEKKVVWDSEDSKWLWDYDEVSMYSLNPHTNNNEKDFKKGTHENAYNLITIDDNFKYLKKDMITNVKSAKKNKEPILVDGNTVNPEDNIVNLDDNTGNSSQDLGWPLITKLDKTGEYKEPSDKYTFYTGINPNNRYLQQLNKDSQIKKFIDAQNDVFFENKSFDIKKTIYDYKLINNNEITKEECIHLIGFFDSLPINKKYDIIRTEILPPLYEKCKNIDSKLNKSEISFGLGYVYDDVKKMDNSYQSMHNFLYIPNKGVLVLHKENYPPIEFSFKKKNTILDTSNTMKELYKDKNIYEIKEYNSPVKILLDTDKNKEYYLTKSDNDTIYLKVDVNGKLVETVKKNKNNFKLK